ncbi:MAG: Bifunctional protein [Elusimicrobia bacterium]|nr:Bifunctional protein [Elusimicrobiota bacterium]
MTKKIITYTDGASRGNPGHAGIGALLLDENGATLAEASDYVGVATNNEAEYRALILALSRALEMKATVVECYLDSELVVRQLNGLYRVKSEKMFKFFEDVKSLILKFKMVTFTHVPREHPNQKIADRLANRGIDQRT